MQRKFHEESTTPLRYNQLKWILRALALDLWQMREIDT